MNKLIEQIPYKVVGVFNRLRCFINKHILLKRLEAKFVKLHVGCGTVRLAGFLNIDYRPTVATDLTHNCSDLSLFSAKTFQSIYSNAFFEHLYINEREACLKSLRRILKDDGMIVFVGIPDFRRIATAYLEKEAGIESDVFDLHEVYRYTHGLPEAAPDFWLEQLHKSLFDIETIQNLLEVAGFQHYSIFSYCYREEKIPLNMGFVAFKQKPDFELSRDWLVKLLNEYTDDINRSSTCFIGLRRA